MKDINEKFIKKIDKKYIMPYVNSYQQLVKLLNKLNESKSDIDNISAQTAQIVDQLRATNLRLLNALKRKKNELDLSELNNWQYFVLKKWTIHFFDALTLIVNSQVIQILSNENQIIHHPTVVAAVLYYVMYGITKYIEDYVPILRTALFNSQRDFEIMLAMGLNAKGDS